jgi:hypothetical protein
MMLSSMMVESADVLSRYRMDIQLLLIPYQQPGRVDGYKAAQSNM